MKRSLAFSAQRRENYERYMRSSRRRAEVDYLPIKLDIENVSRCNFRCTMCVVSDWQSGKRADDLPLEQFKRLIDEQYGLVEIKLQGIGEPLLQGDPVFDMIRYARSKCIWVRTTTNASLLHLKDNHRKLVDSGVNEIQISIDGADKDTFESIRRGSRFERVVQNCRLINDYCLERELALTKMWTVVQSGNQHQLGELVHLASRLGFTNQVFSLELTGWGDPSWTARNAAATATKNVSREDLDTLVELGKRLGVKVAFWDIAERFSASSLNTLCPWPFERAVVTSDQRTVPCCIIGDPDAFEIGCGSSFVAAWRSSDYERFRQAHIDGQIPDVCRSCYKVGE